MCSGFLCWKGSTNLTVITLCLWYETEYHEHSGGLSFPEHHLVAWQYQVRVHLNALKAWIFCLVLWHHHPDTVSFEGHNEVKWSKNTLYIILLSCALAVHPGFHIHRGFGTWTPPDVEFSWIFGIPLSNYIYSHILTLVANTLGIRKPDTIIFHTKHCLLHICFLFKSLRGVLCRQSIEILNKK